MIDLSPYSHVLVLDTQMVLEGKPLPDLPWGLIDPVGPILLLCMPKMLSEVDQAKRDGRIGPRARKFNRMVEPAVGAVGPVVLVDGSPRVDIALASTSRIDWDAVPDLDRDEGDDRIVGEALNAHVSDVSRLTLFGYDMRPRAAAARHGLMAMKPEESWILEPEPSPHDKENLRLRQRVRDLEETQPQVSARFELEGDEAVQLVRVKPLSQSEVRIIGEMWLEKHPAVGSSRFDMLRDYSYDRAYDDFENKVKSFGHSLHDALEKLFNQVRLRFHLANSGSIPADHLDVQFEGNGALLHQQFSAEATFLPSAPDYRPGMSSVLSHGFNTSMAGIIPKKLRRDELAFEPLTSRTQTAQLICADFRQGRSSELPLYVTLDPYRASPARIMATVTAANLSGRIPCEIEIAYTTEDVSFSDLIDASENKLLRDFRLQETVAAMINAQQYDEIEGVED